MNIYRINLSFQLEKITFSNGINNPNLDRGRLLHRLVPQELLLQLQTEVQLHHLLDIYRVIQLFQMLLLKF